MTDTARSSITILDSSPTYLPQSLKNEMQKNERRMKMYGGNDVKDPPVEVDTSSANPFSMSTSMDPNKNMVAWDGDDDTENPQNFSFAKKWRVTLLCVLMTLSVSFGSSAPASASAHLISTFHINTETSYANMTVYLLGLMFGPILWGPGSEIYGRRRGLMFTMSCFTLSHIGQGLAKNIDTFLISRFLCGFFGVSAFTVSGGIIADVWPVLGRGPATSLFSASTFLGPVLGPIVGGFIAQSTTMTWRWIIWIMMIFAGVATASAILFLPETYAPVLLLRKAQRLRQQDPEGTKNLFAEHESMDFSLKGLVHRTIYRPFQMLGMEPILTLITVYMSLVYGVLYALFQALPFIFMKTRGFTAGQSGLIFIGVGIGTTLGSIVNHLCSLHYPKLVVEWRGFPPPEQRLFGAMFGGPALVIGGFWLGWTGQYSSIHWSVPAIGTVVLGFGIALIFISFMSYVVDTYLMYSASAFAANTVVRSLVAAVFPLFITQMLQKMGINWACTLISLIALFLSPIPYLFYIYGPRIRARSKFAPCVDLKIAAEMQQAKQVERSEKVQP